MAQHGPHIHQRKGEGVVRVPQRRTGSSRSGGRRLGPEERFTWAVLSSGTFLIHPEVLRLYLRRPRQRTDYLLPCYVAGQRALEAAPLWTRVT